MRFFYDFEFHENGKIIDPISLGIVAENGHEYYAVFRDTLTNTRALLAIRKHRFLMEQIVPHLPSIAQRHIQGEDTLTQLTPTHSVIKPGWRIADEVASFIKKGGTNRADNELWAWYGAYDHVTLCQLWGPMAQLPPSVPMFTHDLQQEAHRHGVTDLRAAVGKVAGIGEHHALADARWNAQAWRHLTLLTTGVEES